MERFTMTTTAQLFEVSSTGKWVSGLKTEISIRDFSPVFVDEPKALGGKDEAPNPVEYVLAGLTSCTSVMIALIAKEQDFSYSAVEFSNKGTLDLRGLAGDPNVSPHFETVSYNVDITTDESNDKIEALRVAVENRCPVLNLLKDANVKINANWTKR